MYISFTSTISKSDEEDDSPDDGWEMSIFSISMSLGLLGSRASGAASLPTAGVRIYRVMWVLGMSGTRQNSSRLLGGWKREKEVHRSPVMLATDTRIVLSKRSVTVRDDIEKYAWILMFKAVLNLVLSGVAWSCLVTNDLYLNYQEGIEDHIRRSHNKQPMADLAYWKNSERVDEYCSSEIRWQPRTQAGWVNSNSDNSPGLGDQFLCPRGSNLNHGRKSLKNCLTAYIRLGVLRAARNEGL
ncbi:hypothetical protein C8J57DRAFT_1220650 [Mycena rebaudengoi]|nr:hypothetical protein C8J57DRAFT_1220650 [Mycena rebaudengoi]